MLRRIALTLGLLVLSAAFLSAQAPAGNRSGDSFQGPELSEAGELTSPAANIPGYGIVILEPTIGADGAVESVEVIRSTPGLESWGASGVKTWKFRPATLNGKEIRSRTTVVAIFNQGYNVPPAISLPPLVEHPEDQDQRRSERDDTLADFTPPLPTEVVIPAYPVMSVMTTTVALRVWLSSAGEMESADPLRDVATYAPRAVAAMKKWKFSPASFAGQPVRSQMMVAVFFAPGEAN